MTHLVLEAISRVSVADGGLLHGRRERGLRRPPVEAGAAVGRLIKDVISRPNTFDSIRIRLIAAKTISPKTPWLSGLLNHLLGPPANGCRGRVSPAERGGRGDGDRDTEVGDGVID